MRRGGGVGVGGRGGGGGGGRRARGGIPNGCQWEDVGERSSREGQRV
jgi:hypothetical protein